MTARRPWTRREGAEAYRLRRAGRSCREIGQAVGRSPSSVNWLFKRLRRSGIAVPPGPRGGGLPPIPLDMERARQLRAEGWRYIQIAEAMGVSLSTIWRRLKFGEPTWGTVAPRARL